MLACFHEVEGAVTDLVACSLPGQRRLKEFGFLLVDDGAEGLAQRAESLVVPAVKSVSKCEVWVSKSSTHQTSLK